MIKKFNEYFAYNTRKTSIKFEELEDEFLRLKEVFGCKFWYYYYTNREIDIKGLEKIRKEIFQGIPILEYNFDIEKFRICIFTYYDTSESYDNSPLSAIPFPFTPFNEKEILELQQIKRRIENKYNVIMNITKPGGTFSECSFNITFTPVI